MNYLLILSVSSMLLCFLSLTPALGQPWGKPSSPLTIASLSTPQGPVTVAFIARHGTAHNIPPTNVPARANIAALKHLGCKAIVAFSAVGSLREEIRPGDLIVPSQIIDRTKVWAQRVDVEARSAS